MRLKLRIFLATTLLSIGFSGCVHNEMFSCLDYCYLADWTNHHSHISCCCKDDSCQQP
jgi:hypothetical protein